MAKNDLQGALDLLILKTLSQLGSMHGYGIVMHIRRVTDEVLIVKRARKKSLDLNPQNENARDVLKKLEVSNQ
jgi:DNA-binding PadR family transcriptional regulator